MLARVTGLTGFNSTQTETFAYTKCYLHLESKNPRISCIKKSVHKFQNPEVETRKWPSSATLRSKPFNSSCQSQ